jgi:hypothetical protein
MGPHRIPVAPRVALARWLTQIHYNAIRNIETAFPNIMQSDRARPLRGFKIAEDLVLTRKRTFYRIAGTKAIPMSVEEVSANYNLEILRASYRAATEQWKSAQRSVRRTRVS